MEYKIGKYYDIKPFKLDIYKGKFVGYIQDPAYKSNLMRNPEKYPVFKFKFYKVGDPWCLMTIDKNGHCLAHGNDTDKLMEDFKKQWTFNGSEYAKIRIGVNEDTSFLLVDKKEFIRQAREAKVPRGYIKTCLDRGFYTWIQGKTGGEIKYCPTCKVIRQTSCSACGCGNCETCGKRWSCLPPNINLPYQTTSPGIFPNIILNAPPIIIPTSNNRSNNLQPNTIFYGPINNSNGVIPFREKTSNYKDPIKDNSDFSI